MRMQHSEFSQAFFSLQNIICSFIFDMQNVYKSWQFPLLIVGLQKSKQLEIRDLQKLKIGWCQLIAGKSYTSIIFAKFY